MKYQIEALCCIPYIILFSKWFAANKVSLICEKSCYMVFPPDKSNNKKIYVNGIEIQKVGTC